MAFARAGWTEEMDRLVTIDEAELGQGEDTIAVERRLEGEVEAGKRFDRCKPAHAQGCLDAAVLAQGQFLGEEDIDGFESRQLTVFKAAYDMVESFQRSWHLQADKIMTNTIEHGRDGIEGPAHERLSCARTLPTAS